MCTGVYIMYNIDRQVEIITDNLHTDLYSTDSERYVCEICESGYYLEYADESNVSRYDNTKTFCCEECRDQWDEENKHDYEV